MKRLAWLATIASIALSAFAAPKAAAPECTIQAIRYASSPDVPISALVDGGPKDLKVDLDLAERLGLPVDAGRIGAYGPNVTVLRDFVRSSRQPL
jgi:hypothetical protein